MTVRRYLDMTGERFDGAIVVSIDGRMPDGGVRWLVRCRSAEKAREQGHPARQVLPAMRGHVVASTETRRVSLRPNLRARGSAQARGLRERRIARWDGGGGVSRPASTPWDALAYHDTKAAVDKMAERRTGCEVRQVSAVVDP